MSNEIWINNPTILLNENKIMELWPSSSMIVEEKINAITRLILLITMLGYLITMRFNIILLGMLAIICILVIYKIKNTKENFISHVNNRLEYSLNKDNFDKSKKTNPFMNVLIPDIYYNKDKKPAAPTYNSNVEKEINDNIKDFISDQFNDDNIKKKIIWKY